MCAICVLCLQVQLKLRHRVSIAIAPLEDEKLGVPIGRPVTNYTLHVLDSSRCDLPVGSAGELYIGGAGALRACAAAELLCQVCSRATGTSPISQGKS